MTKGKYEYYNSKLVTKKAETLRDEFVKDVAELLKRFDYKLEALYITLNDDKPKIYHEFKLGDTRMVHWASDFYSLYQCAVDIAL